MERTIFWNKISNYALVVMITALVAKMFFKKYFESIILYILIIGVMAAMVFFTALLMKYLSTKSK